MLCVRDGRWIWWMPSIDKTFCQVWLVGFRQPTLHQVHQHLQTLFTKPMPSNIILGQMSLMHFNTSRQCQWLYWDQPKHGRAMWWSINSRAVTLNKFVSHLTRHRWMNLALSIIRWQSMTWNVHTIPPYLSGPLVCCYPICGQRRLEYGYVWLTKSGDLSTLTTIGLTLASPPRRPWQ